MIWGAWRPSTQQKPGAEPLGEAGKRSPPKNGVWRRSEEGDYFGLCDNSASNFTHILDHIAYIAQMRPIASAVTRSVVCVSVCVLVKLMYCAIRLNRSRCRLGREGGGVTHVGQRNRVLDEV